MVINVRMCSQPNIFYFVHKLIFLTWNSKKNHTFFLLSLLFFSSSSLQKTHQKHLHQNWIYFINICCSTTMTGSNTSWATILLLVKAYVLVWHRKFQIGEQCGPARPAWVDASWCYTGRCAGLAMVVAVVAVLLLLVLVVAAVVVRQMTGGCYVCWQIGARYY